MLLAEVQNPAPGQVKYYMYREEQSFVDFNILVLLAAQ